MEEQDKLSVPEPPVIRECERLQERAVELVVTVRLIVAANPFRGEIVTGMGLFELPINDIVLVDAWMEKSGLESGPTVIERLTEWVKLPLVAESTCV